MSEYLYLYSFVYLRQNSSSSILFNVFNRKRLISNSPVINDILYRIEKTNLTYKGCFLSRSENQDPTVLDFLQKIIEYSFGGLLSVNRGENPIQFPSDIYVQGFTRKDNELAKKFFDKDLNKYKGKKFKLFEERVSKKLLNNFISLTLYMSSISDDRYKNVSNQYRFPIYSENCKSLDVENVLEWIFPNKPKILNLIIGDLDDKIFEKIEDLLSLNIPEIRIYVLSCNFDKNRFFKLKERICKIYMWHLSDFSNEFKIECLDDGIIHYCLCKDEDDVSTFEDLDKGNTMFIVPYYDGTNSSFVKKYLSFDVEELLDKVKDEICIRTNSIINSNIFGEIRITVEGDIYTDINGCKLGNIANISLINSIRFELLRYRNWFITRKDCSCSNCLYSDICPPLFDIENYMREIKFCENIPLNSNC